MKRFFAGFASAALLATLVACTSGVNHDFSPEIGNSPAEPLKLTTLYVEGGITLQCVIIEANAGGASTRAMDCTGWPQPAPPAESPTS